MKHDLKEKGGGLQPYNGMQVLKGTIENNDGMNNPPSTNQVISTCRQLFFSFPLNVSANRPRNTAHTHNGMTNAHIANKIRLLAISELKFNLKYIRKKFESN